MKRAWAARATSGVVTKGVSVCRPFWHRRLCLAAVAIAGIVYSAVAMASLEEAKRALRTRQYAQAEQLLKPLATAGDLEAQYLLASLYSTNQGVARDYEQYRYWLTQAANQGHAQAALNLGALYESGKGGSKDVRLAKEWYQRAAQLGLAAASQRLETLESALDDGVVVSTVEDLMRLIRQNDAQGLEAALQSSAGRAHVNSLDTRGYTPLTFAIERDLPQLLSLLLASGANPDQVNTLGDSPLALALQLRRQASWAALLKAGADVNRQDALGNTPLHLAASKGDAPAIKALLGAGAQPNTLNKKGFTPLDAAQTVKNGEVIALLKTAGGAAGELSNLTAPQNEPSDALILKNLSRQAEVGEAGDNPYKNWPPLNIAAWRGQADAVRLLLANPATNVDSLDPEGFTPLLRAAYQGHDDVLEMLLVAKANVVHQVQDGRYALQVAAQRGHNAAVQRLLKAGAQEQPTKGQEPLLNALARTGQQEIALTLLPGLTEVDVSFESRTPLHHAAERGHDRLLKALLSRKATVNATDKLRYTPLHLAILHGHEAAAKLLLAAKSSLQAEDIEGNTPLALAAFKGRHQLVPLLIVTETLEKTNAKGNTPLMLAAQAGHEPVVTLLLNAGASVEARNGATLTPLMLAAQAGHVPVVKALLAKGASPKRRNRDGHSALELAKRAKQQQVAALLEQQQQGIF